MAHVAGKRVVVVVPGVHVWITQVTPPQTSQSNQEKAIPFLLEEQLSCPVEELHFAFGKRQDHGTLTVAVTARARFSRWLAALHDADIQPDACVCEPLLLPWQPGTWTVLLTPTTALVRTGMEAGFALDAVNCERGLSMALQEASSMPRALHVLDYAPVPPRVDWTGFLPIPVHVEEKTGEPLALLAAHHQADGSLSLLQGAYAPRAWVDAWWRPFRLTAALLVGWLLSQGGYAFMTLYQLSQYNLQVAQRMETQYRQTFPQARRVIDPHAQMQQQLNALRQTSHQEASHGFLELMAQSGTVLKNFPEVTFTRVRFQEGKLDLVLHVAELAQLDRIREQMTRIPTLSASIQRIDKRGEGVDGTLRLVRP